jgi:hypothetical protein
LKECQKKVICSQSRTFLSLVCPPKNWFFPNKLYFPKKIWLLFTFVLCKFSVRTLKYFQKNFKLIFFHKNFKKLASNVAHNWPRPFYFTVQPRPQPRIDFSYHEISGPDICSLICGKSIYGVNKLSYQTPYLIYIVYTAQAHSPGKYEKKFLLRFYTIL